MKAKTVILLMVISSSLFANTDIKIGFIGASTLPRMYRYFKKLAKNVCGLEEGKNLTMSFKSGYNPYSQRKNLLKGLAKGKNLDLLVMLPSANGISNPNYENWVSKVIEQAKCDYGVKNVALSNVGPRFPTPRPGTTRFNNLHARHEIKKGKNSKYCTKEQMESGKHLSDQYLYKHYAIEDAKEPGVCGFCVEKNVDKKGKHLKASHGGNMASMRSAITIFTQIFFAKKIAYKHLPKNKDEFNLLMNKLAEKSGGNCSLKAYDDSAEYIFAHSKYWANSISQAVRNYKTEKCE